MKHLMKIVFALMALSLLLAVGCGSDKAAEEPKEEAKAEAAAPAEPEVKKVVFASDCSWPPMEFVDADKNFVGFDIDLINAMGREGGFEPVIQNTAWDGIFGGLIAGKYDAILSSVSITDERKATMDFSDPYFEVKQGVVVQKDSGIATVADLAGKVVAAQIGTTGYFAVEKMDGVTAKSYDEVGLAIADLANGRLAAVVCDDSVAADYALQNPDFKDVLDLAFLIESDTPEYLGWAVQKGSAELIATLNSALAKVKASGEYDTIFNKWFPSN